ncbi:MAG: hypothetical protein ACR2QC_00670 [Gammaproteobacteria bacterium]
MNAWWIVVALIVYIAMIVYIAIDKFGLHLRRLPNRNAQILNASRIEHAGLVYERADDGKWWTTDNFDGVLTKYWVTADELRWALWAKDMAKAHGRFPAWYYDEDLEKTLCGHDPERYTPVPPPSVPQH